MGGLGVGTAATAASLPLFVFLSVFSAFMEDAGFTMAPAACCLPALPRVLIEEEREDDSLGTALELAGAVRFDPSPTVTSFAAVTMGKAATWELIGELGPEAIIKEEKLDRKETMKMYMRNYRRRQKTSLDALPAHEKEMIKQKQRERVRERVRRHRLRKKLKASGLSQDEIEKRLQELVPSSARDRSDIQGFGYGRNQSRHQSRHQMAICLDFPIAKAAPLGHHAAITGDVSLRNQLPDMLGSQAPFVMQENYVPGHSARLDFDQQSEPLCGEYEDGHMSEMKLSPSTWNINQVGVFLDGLELSHLKPSFEKNAIDGVALLSLTPARLCDMGVNPNEIREELLLAIDSLKKVSMCS